jgi:hypothetical protein
MSASPRQPSAPGSPSRRASYANPGMRISDAERAEVADRLSKHYGDGRLDQAEFDKRLHQAMSAKTQQDLGGVFADLPDDEAPEAATPQRRGRNGNADPSGRADREGHPDPIGHSLQRLLFLVLVIAVTAVGAQLLIRSYLSWFLIGLLAILWFRHGPWQHRRP